jgi:hypothetical protein
VKEADMKHPLFAVILAVMLISVLPSQAAETPGPNRPPVAEGGMDHKCLAGEKVFLDGSGSYDPEGHPLSFFWELLTAPEGAGREVLGNRFGKTATFMASNAGIYLVALAVSDGKLYSERDVVRVSVVDPPTKPDLMVTDLKALGLFDGKYLDILGVTLKNRGGRFDGPVTVNIMALDRLQGGHVSFGKSFLKSLSLEQGEEVRLNASRREIEWPESACTVSFGVTVTAEAAEETTSNNFAQLTGYRDSLHGDCSPRIDSLQMKREKRPGQFDYDVVRDGDEVVLRKGDQNIYLYLTHCCPQPDRVEIAVIYNEQASHETKQEKKLSFVLDPPGDDPSRGSRKESASIRVSSGQERARHVLAGVRIPETASSTPLAIVRKRPDTPFYEILFRIAMTTK